MMLMPDGKLDKFSIIVSIIALIIPLYFQFYAKAPAESTIIFGLVIIVAIGLLAFDWINSNMKKLDELSKKVIKMEEKFKYMKNFHDLDKRISILEKTKKGFIDPRIILIILLVLLVFLYLRSIGFFV